MPNPFVYSKPVAPEALIDRNQERTQLLELLQGGHNCRLSAPRRYGKTSLVHNVRAVADREGTPTVYVNFYGILSLEEAVARLERGYRQLRGPLARWVTGKLEGLSVSLSTPAGSLGVSGMARRAPERLLHELLDLPAQLFARSGARVLVCFDEFQEVLSTRFALDGAIRSAIEAHHDEAAYLFSGSHPGMMRALFEDRERPFYGQARAISLAPLAAEDVADYVGSQFESTRRDVTAALRPLLAVSQGHPQRAMMLAHFLWEMTPRDGVADESTFGEALEVVLEELAEAFDRTWRGLDDGQRRTLLAVVISDGRPTRAAALEAADVPRSTVAEALARLRDAGFVFDHDGRVRLVDPLLALWVTRGRADA